MNSKRKALLLFKATSILIFTGTFFYATWFACDEYRHQPVATYLSYTRGDDGYNITFPHITWCSSTFVKDQLNNCRGNASDFLSALYNCLREMPENGFDYDAWKSKMALFNPQDFVLRAEIHVDTTHKVTQPPANLFHFKYHPTYGQCIEVDSEHFHLTVEDGKPNFVAVFNFSVFRTNSAIICSLHPKDDSADALDIHPQLWMKAKEDPEPLYFLKLTKKTITREPTRSSTCGQFNPKTCVDIQKNGQIAQELRCKVPWLYSGHHLETYIEGYANLKTCNDQDTVKAVDIYLENATVESCKNANACYKTKYFMTVEKHVKINHSFNFGLTYPDAEVEHYTTYISYDLPNLIGELGGVLGMTLGLSGLSLAYFFAEFIERFI